MYRKKDREVKRIGRGRGKRERAKERAKESAKIQKIRNKGMERMQQRTHEEKETKIRYRRNKKYRKYTMDEKWIYYVKIRSH
jgi:hypothetical protein